MKILFTQNTPPMSQTGNEHYRPGMDADLRDGWASWLIENGFAAPLDQPTSPKQTTESEPEPQADPMPDYAAMKVAYLRTFAKTSGVYRTGMKKADLVAALGATHEHD